jgi:hypothetical protein
MQRNKEKKKKRKSWTAKHVSLKGTEGLLWMLMTNDVENVVKVCKRACGHVPALFRDKNATGDVEYLFVRIRSMMP